MGATGYKHCGIRQHNYNYSNNAIPDYNETLNSRQTITDLVNPYIDEQEQKPYEFIRTLTVGATGYDVKILQRYLNNFGFIVSEAGWGSSGNESTYFGIKTKRALAQYQDHYHEDILMPLGLNYGTGYFGKSTIAHVNGEIVEKNLSTLLTKWGISRLKIGLTIPTYRSFFLLISKIPFKQKPYLIRNFENSVGIPKRATLKMRSGYFWLRGQGSNL